MIHRISIIFSLWLSVLIIGCASMGTTKLKGFKDPDFANQKIDNIAIYVDLADYSLREEAENAIVNQLAQSGIKSFSSLGVLPPTKQWTREQITDTYLKNGATTRLVVLFDTAGVVTKNNPGYTWKEKSGGGQVMKKDGNGPKIIIEESESEFTVKPSQSNTSWAQFSIEISELSTNKIIWKGAALSTSPRGNADLMQSLCETLSQEIIAANMK